MRLHTSYLLSLLLLASVGCGSSDGEDSRASAHVTDIQLDDTTINEGEGTVARINFTFDHNAIFRDGTNLVVVVKIGERLEYRADTAEIQGGGDKSIGAQVTRCRDGTSFLVFDMDEFDLANAASLGGDADAQLSLTVDAPRQIGSTPIVGVATAVSSRADYDQALFNCGSQFFPDQAVAITVF